MIVMVRSFAKINLGLRIGAARPDGFHDLLTVYQTIGLHDVVHVSVKRGTGIEIRCNDALVPKDESNTCWRIVEETMRALRAKGRVVIEIEKRLPVQGGLGGASSNAVAAMLGLERALKKALPAPEKLQAAADVGSDLPLFLIGGTVLGIGHGEQVYPLPDLPATGCVIVTSDVGVSTPKAFAEWDRQCAISNNPTSRAKTAREMGHPLPYGPTQPESAPMQAQGKLTVSDASDRINLLSRGFSAWLSEPYSSAPSGSWARGGRAGNPLLWLVRAGIENDFEQVVFPEYPQLREGKEALLRVGAKYASLSGSGSALYGLFASRGSAAQVAAKLRKQGWAAQATTTLPRRLYWRRTFD